MKEIYLAGGCFWGVQKYFDQFAGILKTTVGYANGKTANPVYADVKKGLTGHSETVKISYDETVITLKEILDAYFLVIDPCAINHQGEDVGISYRTGIYYTDEKDLPVIKDRMREEQKKYPKPLAVEVEKLENFYDAEDYHQKYLEKNPGGYCHIPAQMFHLKEN